MPKLSHLRSIFFSHPIYPAGFAWLTTTIGYLVPTLLKILPLSENNNNAKTKLDTAQNNYNAVLDQLKKYQEKIREAKQRVIDLDCAMKGYSAFNQEAENFQKSVSGSTLSPLDQLNLLWGKMQFVADKTTVEKYYRYLSWEETIHKEEWRYECVGEHICGANIKCCYHDVHYDVVVQHPYTETTTITNYFENILQGGPFNLRSLSCGYYSRAFGVSSPNTVLMGESPYSYHGHKEDGATFIDFSRDFGSQLKGSCLVDEQSYIFNTAIMHGVNQEKASADLASRLFRFLSTCVLAFEAIGANYSVVQEKIRESIPILIDNATAVNATLQEKAIILAEETANYGQAHQKLVDKEIIWLPQLLLVPGLVAAFVYLVFNYCKNRENSYSSDYSSEYSSGSSRYFRLGNSETCETGNNPQPTYMSPSCCTRV